MHTITLLPEGILIPVDEETSIKSALTAYNVAVKSSCGGKAICLECLVKIRDGKDNLSEPTELEKRQLGSVFHITGERLACQTFVKGDVTIELVYQVQNQTTESSSNSPKETRVRKKEQVEEIYKERRERKESRAKEREEKWFKPWEKKTDEEENAPKRLGGNRRPRGFKFDPEENTEPKKSTKIEKSKRSEDFKKSDDFEKEKRPSRKGAPRKSFRPPRKKKE
jgi:ferredoxin